MLKRISQFFYRLSPGWAALLALVVFVVFTALVLPAQASQAEAVSGGAGSPDTSLFYSAADLYRMAEAYGQPGRQAYLRARWTFDVIWPLVYTAFLITATSWLLAKVFSPASAWRLLNLLPLAAMLFDFLENSSASLVMARYPQLTPGVDLLAPLFTLVKWLLVATSFGLLLFSLVAALWARRKAAGLR